MERNGKLLSVICYRLSVTVYRESVIVTPPTYDTTQCHPRPLGPALARASFRGSTFSALDPRHAPRVTKWRAEGDIAVIGNRLSVTGYR